MEEQGLRQKKVSRLLEKTFNEHFRSKAADFSGAMITTTAIWVAKDLKVCRVYLSIFGINIDKKKVLDLIIAQNKAIRGHLGQKLGKQLQFIPELYFKLDNSFDDMAEIERLLAQ